MARTIRSEVLGRLRWRGALLVVVVVSLSFGAWTALAQTVVPTTQNPLPDSQFQGGDGNQDNASGIPACGPTGECIDWRGLQADGRVGHTTDPSTLPDGRADTIFTGGSSELAPENWGITLHASGATPASDNILDLYRAFEHAPGKDGFLYLAFVREATTGTTYLTLRAQSEPGALEVL